MGLCALLVFIAVKVALFEGFMYNSMLVILDRKYKCVFALVQDVFLD
jgi:hypothetical protein